MSALRNRMYIACRFNGDSDYEEVQRLIDQGVDIECFFHGRTVLMYAANLGHVKIIQLLLDNQASINSKSNRGGWTALVSAASRGCDGAVSLLIERGADLHIKGLHPYTLPRSGDSEDRTALDEAKRLRKSSTAAILEAAIESTKVIYTASDDLHHDKVTLKEFNENIIILSDNDIPDGYVFEEHPTFTLRHLQQYIGQLRVLLSANNEDDISPNNLHNALAQSNSTIASRLQYWRMNLLHLLVYFPRVPSNDIHEALSSILTICPRAITSVDIHGMTPLHHATINLSRGKISQDCHDLLLRCSPSIVVHRAIEAGMGWDHLRPIVMAKVNALTMEDEESGLVPFMLAAERCNNDDDNNILESLTMVYELLCLQSDVMNEYDKSIVMTKRVRDQSSYSNDQDTKRARGIFEYEQ